MEWLKKLLEGAKKKEDGSLDIESLMKQINTEFPKNAVPKETFNDINSQLKTANTTIADLKKNNGDNEALQKTIKEHEETIKTLEANAANTKKEYALKDKLKDLGVTDADYLIYKHGGIDKFNWDKDNNIIGLEETIKPYKESISHIFKTDKVDTKYNPTGGGNYTGKNPFAKDTFNLTEQGKILKENPAQAKELASTAGLNLNI
ncbi:minor structural protein (endogenous virus) [Clostridium phage phiCT9441A]|uniref:head scaffolding protein n=1 Tax=Clostridium phage phiCT9441A TaxID=1567014 RepID=UPI0005147924|nr:phage scaffolding protein [Clostridium tetani]YP_009219409.1 head scaffolding protein [Clostridium phage phiCT9441A]AJA42656.1 minor structural protein [Clostridium phage phiCT9441A]KGI40314.1 minor structural GP20 protein [Clostridium tetani ATCC 9441]SUY66142.1 minor structural GP20 protein [Clostridium tetani]